ncbi:unnamed protein product [Arctogadus glacialis]
MPSAGPAYVHVFAHSRILRLLPDVIPHHSHSELDDDRSRCVVGGSGVTFSSQPVNGVHGVSQPLHRHRDNSRRGLWPQSMEEAVRCAGRQQQEYDGQGSDMDRDIFYFNIQRKSGLL